MTALGYSSFQDARLQPEDPDTLASDAAERMYHDYTAMGLIVDEFLDDEDARRTLICEAMACPGDDSTPFGQAIKSLVDSAAVRLVGGAA